MERWAAALGRMPRDAQGLLPWLTGSARHFYPFERVLLVHGEQVAGEVRVTHLASHGYGAGELQQLSRTFDLGTRGCFAWWLANRTPICIDAVDPPAYATQFELDEIRQLRMGRIAAHGVVNPAGTAGTYFSFAGVCDEPPEWHVQALRLLAPMLNDLFLRYLALKDESTCERVQLTPRQNEIVRLAARGLTSKGIARELDISEKTVRNQLTVIYERMGVRDCRSMLAAMRVGTSVPIGGGM